MKLAIDSQSLDDLRVQIKARFADFNRSSMASKGRKYPADLRQLVRQGHLAGIRQKDLSILSGMSRTSIRGALAAKLPAGVSPGPAKPPAPRRLKVVGPVGDNVRAPSPLIVRLPSGVTIELASDKLLTETLLVTLARLEVDNVASR